METTFQEMIESESVQIYPNLVAYYEGLFEIRESWAICYRTYLKIRGVNTNNPVEAQFLVLKDNILNRTKEININGLVTKLCIDLTNHYKTKLLNVAVGKFDGCYSDRFKGIGKASKGSCGFTMPPHDEVVRVGGNVENIGDNLYKVPSFSKDVSSYLVDMNSNVCECQVGRNGSVCKHQYILWSLKLSKSSNFIPFLDASERQRYSTIANGSCLALSSYEGIYFIIHFLS